MFIRIIKPEETLPTVYAMNISIGAVFIGEINVYGTTYSGTFLRIAGHIARLEDGFLFGCSATSGLEVHKYKPYPSSELLLKE